MDLSRLDCEMTNAATSAARSSLSHELVADSETYQHVRGGLLAGDG
jgi:hypothetical protein